MGVELLAAEALLEQGVSVPFKEVRIPFAKKSWKPRVTMRRPRLGGQIRISRLRLKMGATYEKMRSFTQEQQDAFMAQHGKTLSKMIALTVCRGFLSGRLLTPIVAWLIREFVDVRFILGAHKKYMTLLGARSFSDIIRSAEELNPMRPTLSQKRKRS
ncbi:MAG: hypothetical protein LBV18_04050 [Alistipes sp.]|jgi:hypothetical protein|nr:hypothetical protein [Alistipes sp.]